MFTQCPQCNSQQTITVKDLRSNEGKVSCTTCASLFNALEHLDDGTYEITEINEFLPEFKKNSKIHSIVWSFGFSICIIALAIQIYLFESYSLTQNSSLRPWLAKSCQFFNCQLPRYKNLSEFAVLHGSFEPKESNYIFETVFTNQAAFTQDIPSIKLTLINFSGQAFAERIFLPEEYSHQSPHLLAPEMSAEITMNIASPANKIGGYRFELI